MTQGNSKAAMGAQEQIEDGKGRESSAEQIARILTALTTAINKREFNPSSFPWTRVASNFSGFVDPRLPMQGGKGLFNIFEALTRENPNYRINIAESTVHIDEAAGRASVFWRGDTTGHFPEVRMAVTGVTEFRRSGGTWLCTAFKGLRGLDSSGLI